MGILVAVCSGWFLLALMVGLIIGRALRIAGEHDTGTPVRIPDFAPDEAAHADHAA